MNNAESELLTRQEQREKVRKRYSMAKLPDKVIMPTDKERLFADSVEKNVAVYVRVSTDDPRQTSSYQLQQNYYTGLVTKNKNWNLIKIYADEGISGTSLNHRDQFLEMLEDCKKGGIDLIITKSVSRFCRNLEDCIHYTRILRELPHPVGVYFEIENIYTLDDDIEVQLAVHGMVAQEESHSKSKSMNASVEMRFSSGLLLTPVLLGYDHDESGKLIINEEEAKTVRLIFYYYLSGYTCHQIADYLTIIGRKTKLKNEKWSSGTVRGVLSNERHCGDVWARKTYTPSYLNHKSKKNKGERKKYYYANNHDPIISRDDFIAVQHMLANAKYTSKYSNKSFLPELKGISDGILKGFVVVHPTWAGFSVEDYFSASIYEIEKEKGNSKSHEAKVGEFDFRGFEVARSQFFDNKNEIATTFRYNGYSFSTKAIRKLLPSEYIEILVNPRTLEIAIRTTTKENKYAIKWATKKAGILYPKSIRGAAYLPVLFNLFSWNTNCRYRINGTIKYDKDNKPILTFDTSDAEIFIPKEALPQEIAECGNSIGGNTKTLKAFPKSWVEGFGDEFYTQLNYQPLADTDESLKNRTEKSVQYSKLKDLNVTPPEKLKSSIESIIADIQGGAVNG